MNPGPTEYEWTGPGSATGRWPRSEHARHRDRAKRTSPIHPESSPTATTTATTGVARARPGRPSHRRLPPSRGRWASAAASGPKIAPPRRLAASMARRSATPPPPPPPSAQASIPRANGTGSSRCCSPDRARQTRTREPSSSYAPGRTPQLQQLMLRGISRTQPTRDTGRTPRRKQPK